MLPLFNWLGCRLYDSVAKLRLHNFIASFCFISVCNYIYQYYSLLHSIFLSPFPINCRVFLKVKKLHFSTHKEGQNCTLSTSISRLHASIYSKNNNQSLESFLKSKIDDQKILRNDTKDWFLFSNGCM